MATGNHHKYDEARKILDEFGVELEHFEVERVVEKVDLPGVLKLMEGIEDRTASFQSTVAYRHGDVKRSFRGVVEGKIAHSIRGTGGFGYDPIFVPDEGDGRTFGEMTEEEKNALSHRARAFRSFGEWFSGAGKGF